VLGSLERQAIAMLLDAGRRIVQSRAREFAVKNQREDAAVAILLTFHGNLVDLEVIEDGHLDVRVRET